MNFSQLYRAVDYILSYGNGAIKSETPVKVFFDGEAYREVFAIFLGDINGRFSVVIETGQVGVVNFLELRKSMDRLLDYGFEAINDETPVRVFLDDELYRDVLAVYPEDRNGRLLVVIKAGH